MNSYQIYLIIAKIGYFPNLFKCAKVIPILKPGKVQEKYIVEIYRSIRFISSIVKFLRKAF